MGRENIRKNVGIKLKYTGNVSPKIVVLGRGGRISLKSGDKFPKKWI